MNSQHQFDFTALDNEYYGNHWKEITRQGWLSVVVPVVREADACSTAEALNHFYEEYS